MLTTFFQGLRYVRPLSRDEVFGFWRESEGSSEHWRDLALSRGFDSWEEWRRTYLVPFRSEERQWDFYHVVSLQAVTQFRGGPFESWVEHIYGDAGLTPTFGVITNRLNVEHGGYVDKLKQSFPRETTVIGVMSDEGVVIVEGMHRCSAIAQAVAEGHVPKTSLRIALGSHLPGTIPLIKRLYKNTVAE